MAPRVKQEVIEIVDSDDDQEEDANLSMPPPQANLGFCKREPTSSGDATRFRRSNTPPPGESRQESLIESMINQCISFHKKLSTYEPLMTSTQRLKWMKHLSSLRDCAALEPQSADAEEFMMDYVALPRPIRTRRVYKRKKRSTARRVRAPTTSRASAGVRSSSTTRGPVASSSASVGSTASFMKAKQTATRIHNHMVRARSMSQPRMKVERTSASSVKVKKEHV